MTSAQIERYRQEMQTLIYRRDALNAKLDEAIASADVESYNFSDSDGAQSARLRDPAKIQEMLDKINARIAQLDSLLSSSGGVHYANLRRVP